MYKEAKVIVANNTSGIGDVILGKLTITVAGAASVSVDFFFFFITC